MSNNLNGLYITLQQLSDSSGLNIAVIKKDIKNNLLRINNKLIWYKDALDYVALKWEKGKDKMYDPSNGGAGHRNFAERVLGIIDDNIAIKNIKFVRLSVDKNET